MNRVLAALVLAAACGSSSSAPAPAVPPPVVVPPVQPPPSEPPVPPPDPPPVVDTPACSGDGFLGISYYGLGCAEPAARDADLTWLAELGVCGPVRVWWNFTRGGDDCSAFRSDGSVREDRFAYHLLAADALALRGMGMDATLDGSKFDDLEAHERAARTLAERLTGHPAVRIIDGCNECEGHSASYQRSVLEALRPFGGLVTISLSGDPGSIEAAYHDIDVPIRAPHWPRVPSWQDRVEGYALDLGGLVYVQEEAREGWQGQHWPADAYVTACQGARRAGAWAYVQHTASGFDPRLGSLREQLDATTLDALEREAATGCRP